MQTNAQSPRIFDAQLREVFAHYPQAVHLVLFGSVASGQQRADSDLYIALTTDRALTLDEKIALIGALAQSTGQAIDLIDLNGAPEPLLGQIVQHGKRILGSDTAYGLSVSRHLIEQADFMPYQARIPAERRMAWIGKESNNKPESLRSCYRAWKRNAQRRPAMSNGRLKQTSDFERSPAGFNNPPTLGEQAALRSIKLSSNERRITP